MNLWESALVALDGIRANKLRSSLTVLGVVIGVAAVIAVVAVGQGGRAMVLAEMEGFGTNIFAVHLDWREDPLGELRTGREFTEQDLAAIRKAVPEVRHLAPVSTRTSTVRGPRRQGTAQIIGTGADYAVIRNLEVTRGRFLSGSDQEGDRRVAVLDGGLAREIFGRRDPLGQRVTINGTPVLVVGVLDEKKSFLDFLGTKYVYVPLAAWQHLFNQPAVIHQIEGAAGDREQVREALRKTVVILERRHNAPGRYMGSSLEQEMEIVGQVTGVITLVVGAVAGISLFVVGVGVMNIMLVSVTERVREIGVRMAVGARRRDILAQFLIEAVVLCLIGGLVGVLIGIGVAFLIAALADWPPLVSWWTVLLAVLFSGAVGVFFGIYPANQAARLNPIEALRRE